MKKASQSTYENIIGISLVLRLTPVLEIKNASQSTNVKDQWRKATY